MSYSIGSEPDPFGAQVVASGNYAYDNPFRFSTKYADGESSLLYYGYRFYSPSLGRWISRDPVGDESFFRIFTQAKQSRERGNLRFQSLMPSYLFAVNTPIALVDPTGLSVSSFGCSECGPMADAVAKVNAALNAGACKEWFEDHGHDYSGGTPGRSVNCNSSCKLVCLFGGTAWTMPGMAIGFCNSKCDSMSAIEIASILIHELAHHYCTIGPGREACAISAQDACTDAVVNP